MNTNSLQPNPLSKLCTEDHIKPVLKWEFSELTTFTSPFIMAFSHELQPLGPIVFSGPLQPSTQFSWHGWHSPDASYLLVGQTVVQKGPSFTFLQSVQLPGPGPWHVELHSSWHNIHTLGAALYILYKKNMDPVNTSPMSSTAKLFTIARHENKSS